MKKNRAAQYITVAVILGVFAFLLIRQSGWSPPSGERREQTPQDAIYAMLDAALAEGVPHLEGVTFCLNRLLDPTPEVPTLDLSDRPCLAELGQQPLSLTHYNQLLQGEPS